MTFGKRTTKKQHVKKNVDTSKSDTTRDNLIVERIKGIVDCTDAGCCPIQHVKDKMTKVKDVENFIKKCVRIHDYIMHRGWVYNKLWTIEDLNEISNDKIVINDFNGDNSKIDNDLLIKLTALYEKENEAIKVTWFEVLINRGVLHMSKKQLYQSLERLMRSGKIYEPHIGEFAPTYDNI